jgi:predicted RNase H-like nuclease (RuvC/YqgF family)
MGKQVRNYKKQEDKLQTKVNSMGKELKHDEWMIEHVKDENRELRQLEKELERHQKQIAEDAESWSSDGVNEKTNTIH